MGLVLAHKSRQVDKATFHTRRVGAGDRKLDTLRGDPVGRDRRLGQAHDTHHLCLSACPRTSHLPLRDVLEVWNLESKGARKER